MLHRCVEVCGRHAEVTRDQETDFLLWKPARMEAGAVPTGESPVFNILELLLHPRLILKVEKHSGTATAHGRPLDAELATACWVEIYTSF